MAAVFAYGLGHYLDSHATVAIGALVLCLTLFVCTGMIYACIKFLQEWASPLTVANYGVLGCASGFTLATAFAAFTANGLVPGFALAAMVLTALGLATRSASLLRNGRLRPKSSLQTATGIHHPRIKQTPQGFMGGSYSTREFFRGRSQALLRSVKWGFLVLAFAAAAARRRLAQRIDAGAVPGLRGAVHRPDRRAMVLLRAVEPPAEPVLPGDLIADLRGHCGGCDIGWQ